MTRKKKREMDEAAIRWAMETRGIKREDIVEVERKIIEEKKE